MLISRSLGLKILVTVVAAGVFVSLYDTTILDSKYVTADDGTVGMPAPGQRLTFMATAYCKGLQTTSGVAVQAGVAAADPALLPVGSIVKIDSAEGKYDGIYSVLDTGPAIQGRSIDVYMWSCNEALQFGRQQIHLSVMRLGWSPRAVEPTLIDRLLLKRPERSSLLPARPLPLSTP